MSKVGDYFFEFPASRGTQGSTVILMMTVPARALSRVLATDNTGSTLERSQREINPTRGKKVLSIFSQRLREKRNHLLFHHWSEIVTQK